MFIFKLHSFQFRQYEIEHYDKTQASADNVCPIYCRSIKMNAAKYVFRAGMVWLANDRSELKMLMRNLGANRITLQAIPVYKRTKNAISMPHFLTFSGRLAP